MGPVNSFRPCDVYTNDICVSNLNTIGSDNGLSPGRRQAIIWTNEDIVLIGPLGTNFNEILIEIHIFSFMKIHFKMSSGKRRLCCLGLNVLTNDSSSNNPKLAEIKLTSWLVPGVEINIIKFAKCFCVWWRNSLNVSTQLYHRSSYQLTFGWTPWWHHDMGRFSALLALCAGNPQSPGPSFTNMV